MEVSASNIIEAGDSIALNIKTALTDKDGSEALTNIRIQGIPNGFTLNNGNFNSSKKEWVLSNNDLDNLRLNAPKDAFGQLNLVVTVSSIEDPSDKETRLDNNSVTTTKNITININANDVPVIDELDILTVDETDLDPTDSDSSVINVNFGNDTPGSFRATGASTVTFTGADNNQLTSGGVSVITRVEGNNYVGRARNEEVFRLSINEKTGQYDFRLSGSLDHANSNNPNDTIRLSFGITARDKDGDVDTGFVRVDVKDDAPIARNDVNILELNAEQKDYNVALVLDISGSMEGDRLDLLKAAVSNLLRDLNSYKNGKIKVHVVPFSVIAFEPETYTITSDKELKEALAFIDSFPAVTQTNYEDALQDTIAWLEGDLSDDPIAGAETYTYFVSDGDTNTYQNNNDQPVFVGVENADIALGEALGTDGTNEVARIKQLSEEVIAVGIDLDAAALGRLNQIDSNGRAFDVQNPQNLDATFKDSNPVTISVEGNVITGESGGSGSSDILGADTPGRVVEISFEGRSMSVSSRGATIKGDFGTLKINSNGSYSYEAKLQSVNVDLIDSFEYVLRDADGDTDVATLQFISQDTFNELSKNTPQLQNLLSDDDSLAKSLNDNFVNTNNKDGVGSSVSFASVGVNQSLSDLLETEIQAQFA